MNFQPRPQTFTCPCCGGFIGEAAPVAMVVEAISRPLGKAIFSRLSRRLGETVSSRALIDHIFADHEDGGPENDRKVFHVTLHHLRRQVAEYGWTIQRKGGGGPGNLEGAFYRLIPTEARQ